MNNWKFNLQQFADDNSVNEQVTEIPAEYAEHYAEHFEGVDKDIALEVLREAGLLNQEKDNPDETNQTSESDKAETGEQEAEKQPDEAEIDEGEGKEEKDDDKHGGDLRVALKIEREKRRKAEELLRQRQNQQQQPVQQPAQQAEQHPVDYEEAIHSEAVRRFEAKYQRKPDFYDPETGAKDITKFQILVGQVHHDVDRYQSQIAEQRTQQQQINQQYFGFVAELRTDELFEAKLQKAFEGLKQFPPTVAQMIEGAVRRLDAGQGTPQDLYIVQNHWNSVNPKETQQDTQVAEQAQETTVTTAPVAPVAPAPNKLEKAKQMEAHTRTNQINGSNTLGGYTLAELERMIQETEWGDIDPKLREMLMSGVLK